ncbi:mobilization protein, partial [Escherichia coli]|nr:mobilization protein [Escherichia coli]
MRHGRDFSGVMGLIQWQESRIAANILAIRDQEETLAKPGKTWGDVSRGQERKFLVLPSGVKVEN